MIQSKEIQLVKIKDVRLNPKNRNKHTDEQIDRLVKIIEYQGFRSPLIVSKRTGVLVAGHGRLMAAKKMKLKEVPVMVQDFTDDAQEYAAMVSDNAIASWAELDLESINLDIANLGPDFDSDLLGLPRFLLEDADNFLNKELWQDGFEHPGNDSCRIIITLRSDDYRDDVIKRLGIKKTKKFKDGKIISITWPDALADE